jgi:hypothetical protein
MISLLLSKTAIAPSGWTTARSPEWKLPPANAFVVASGSLKYYQFIITGQLSKKRDEKNQINLLHDQISPHYNFPHRLSVSRNIF